LYVLDCSVEQQTVGNHNKCSLKPFKIAQNAAHLNKGTNPTINFNAATIHERCRIESERCTTKATAKRSKTGT